MTINDSTTIFVDVNNCYHRKQISHRQLAVTNDMFLQASDYQEISPYDTNDVFV